MQSGTFYKSVSQSVLIFQQLRQCTPSHFLLATGWWATGTNLQCPEISITSTFPCCPLSSLTCTQKIHAIKHAFGTYIHTLLLLWRFLFESSILMVTPLTAWSSKIVSATCRQAELHSHHHRPQVTERGGPRTAETHELQVHRTPSSTPTQEHSFVCVPRKWDSFVRGSNGRDRLLQFPYITHTSQQSNWRHEFVQTWF